MGDILLLFTVGGICCTSGAQPVSLETQCLFAYILVSLCHILISKGNGYE